MAGNQAAWLRRRVHILLRAIGGEWSQIGDFVEGQDKYEVASLGSLMTRIDEALGTLTAREAHAVSPNPPKDVLGDSP